MHRRPHRPGSITIEIQSTDNDLDSGEEKDDGNQPDSPPAKDIASGEPQDQPKPDKNAGNTESDVASNGSPSTEDDGPQESGRPPDSAGKQEQVVDGQPDDRSANTPIEISKIKRATALVITDDGTGTAFCIDARGVFVTNAHVVTGLKQFDLVTLVLNSGEENAHEIRARVARVDEKNDLALLTSNTDHDFPVLETGDAEKLVETRPVFAFGFPFGEALTIRGGQYPSISVNPGHVTSLRKSDGELKLIQIDAQVNPGNSGGPVVDQHGKVVGVVASGFLNQGVHFAIPSGFVRELTEQPMLQIRMPEFIMLNDLDEPFSVEVEIVAESDVDYAMQVTVEGGTSGQEMFSRGDVFTTRVKAGRSATVASDRFVNVTITAFREFDGERDLSNVVVARCRIPVRSERNAVVRNNIDQAGEGLDIAVDTHQFTDKPAIIALPAQVSDVCVGAAGDLVFAWLPGVKKIAVLDLKKAEVSRLISVETDNALIAAGQDHLFVASEDGSLDRYDLAQFVLTKSTRLRFSAPIQGIAIGSAAKGPLLVTAASNQRDFQARFVDPKTLRKANNLKVVPRTTMGIQEGAIRASPDGDVFVFFDRRMFHVLKRKETGYEHFFSNLSPAFVSISPDGSRLMTSSGSFPVELTDRHRQRTSNQPTLVPGLQSLMHMQVVRTRSRASRDWTTVIGLFVQGLESPFAVLVDENQYYLPDSVFQAYDRMGLDKRLILSATYRKLAIVVGNQIEIYDFDLEGMVRNLEAEFLVIVSEPVTRSSIGTEFLYEIKVLSSHKTLEFRLVESPDGMTVDQDGKVRWKPAGRGTHRVVVSITNGDRRQTLHSFTIKVTR